MSGVGIENVPPVHFESSDFKKSTNSGKNAGTLGSAGRKSLQTLQPSGKNRTLLVGADGKLRLGSSGGKKNEMQIYRDPSPKTSTPERKDKFVQASTAVNSTYTQVEEKDTAQSRAELEMYGTEDELSADYWRDLAEKRREALETSLTENEELHTSLSFLEEENQKLKDETEALRSLAERGQELAMILNSALGDTEDGDSTQEDVYTTQEDADTTQEDGVTTQEDVEEKSK
ncbi:geminin [Eurytemora carolleeae]|uniref:geminin n=1 Tax=Eurytemora carolleeae TaxID=1294199 RepID=UPI000C77400D|nr:geminin [Eurytemora carolleeae]|eukprot:XP_023335487.1 geminin-like [Eurytemora affinis]